MPVCIIQNKLQFSLQNLPKLFDPVLSLSLTQTVWSCALLITARIPLQTVYSIDNIHHINCCPCERHAILPKSLARCHSTGPNFVSILYIHTYICTYIHTYRHNLHTYNPWICKCVTKTTGCRTSHKYTNIHNFYSAKYYNHLQSSITDHLYIKNLAKE